MNRNSLIAVSVALMVAALAVHHFSSKDNDEQAVSVDPAPKPAVATTPTVPELPAPAVTTPRPIPVTPASIPAPIAKELAVARAHAPRRPMTQLAKSWFGCNSVDGYNKTMTLIRDKNPSSADHFKGGQADCAPLPTGTHITLMHLDDATGMAQVSIDDTHQVIWTDSSALAGDQNLQQ